MEDSFSFDLLFSTPLYIAQKLARDNVCKFAQELKGELLDIGSGKKPYRRFLTCREYIGLDSKIELKPDLVGIATNLPFAEEIFDSVLCTAVLEHLPEPEKGIKEIWRVLKTDAVAYISVPMTWYLHYEPNDYFRFTKYGLMYLLEKNGFEIIEIERISGLFSYIGVRLTEILFNILVRIMIFLPLKIRTFIGLTLTIPVSLTFYFMGLIFDSFDKKDVFAWGCLVKKK